LLNRGSVIPTPRIRRGSVLKDPPRRYEGRAFVVDQLTISTYSRSLHGLCASVFNTADDITLSTLGRAHQRAATPATPTAKEEARDAERLREWYREHLGLPVADWGGVSFDGREARPGERQTTTVWSVFSGDTSYFEPSTSPFMINYRVDDLDAVLAVLRAEGCEGGPADR
jgi:hypothetical protein